MDTAFTESQEEPHQIETVAKGIKRIPLLTQTLPPATRTNAYLIDTGFSIWIMDPGSDYPLEIERLKRVIEESPNINQRFKGYIITHRHLDHWSGLPALTANYPGLVVSHTPLDSGFSWAHIDEFLETAPGFQVYHTPGHSPDHLVVMTPEKDLLAGDLVAGTGTTLIGSPEGDMSDYMNALRAMISHAPNRIFPAHGPTIHKGREALKAYLKHRLFREALTLKALDNKEAKTVSNLLPSVYPKLPETHLWAAAQSLLSHLQKLQQEGLAQNRDDLWSLCKQER
jgi:glyoxylase-like metal-dependent hydrolase (beta-lactamase superfamily II)